MDNSNQIISLSPENNTSRAIKYINESCDYDDNIKEFYTALGDSEEIGYYRTNEKEDVSSASIFSLLSSSPFPPVVKTHYQFSEEIAVCGCLPDINRYYYIIDNKLFLWHVNSKSFSDSEVDQIQEDEKVIIAVCTIPKSREMFFTKTVDALLAVATPTYIRIYPIENDFINPTVFYTSNISFTPTCLCSGDSDQIFVGGADGQLYLLQFKATQGGIFNDKQISESIQLTKLTAWNIKNVLISFFSFSVAPIYKICFDQTTSLLATIDNIQRIRIYQYENESISLKYSYDPPKGTQFVSINSVYISDSQHLRFVAFTSKGDRYFFGTSETSFGKLNKIALRAEKKAPIELNNETVIDAFQQCGYTAFLCKDSIIGLQVVHVDSTSCYELIGKAKLNGYGISIIGTRHINNWLQTRVFHSPVISQHFMDPIEFFILTSNGGSSINFRPPCHFLRQQLLDANFQYGEACNTAMEQYSSNDESCAMCLLLSTLYPEETDDYIFISGEYDRLHTLGLKIPEEGESVYEDDDDDDDKKGKNKNMVKRIRKDILSPDKLTPITHAFYMRAQRLIRFMWDCTVFYKVRDDLIKVSPQFTVYPDIPKRLNQLIELSHSYIETASLNSEQFDDHQQYVFQIEKDQLHSLEIFLEEIIDILKFIRILRKQKASLLTMAIQNVSSKASNRLENEAFGPPTPSGTLLITALREYAVSLITTYQNMIDTQSKNSLTQYIKQDLDPYSMSLFNPNDVPLRRYDFTSHSKSRFEVASEKVAADPWMRLESNLHLLTAEIIEECPSFLNSPEALIIRAKIDLIAASRHTDLEEKKELAHSAAVTFMKNPGIDFDVSQVCNSFISLGFDAYAVKIASSVAQFVDDAQLGYYWYLNGCKESEFTSKKKFEDVSKIYESAFDAAFSEEGLNAILETNDDLFILLAFQHLLRTNEKDRLLSLDNPLVLDFLRENEPQLVPDYYIKRDQYELAINDLIKYASDVENNEISFETRIKFLQKASNYARKESLFDLAEESQIRIQCAKIQKEMSPEKIGEPLKSLSVLFREAEKSMKWSTMLKIASLTKVDSFFEREMDMKTLWEFFLLYGDGSKTVSNKKPLEIEMNKKLKNLISELGNDADALSPDYMVPAFEDFSDFCEFRPQWTVETLTMLKIDGSKLYNAYAKLINEAELPPERRNQLIYAALWLLTHSFEGDISLILDKIKDVLESSENPFYDEIQKFMKLLE